jgi:hypothetical protein
MHCLRSYSSVSLTPECISYKKLFPEIYPNSIYIFETDSLVSFFRKEHRIFVYLLRSSCMHCQIKSYLVPPAGNLLNWTHISAHEGLIICAGDKHYRCSVWRKKVLSHSNHPFIYLFYFYCAYTN